MSEKKIEITPAPSEASEEDPTDNDKDEGFVYLGGVHKHEPFVILGKDGRVHLPDYEYAESVRRGKERKALVWKIIGNISFWMYLVFNFIKEMFG